jgi:hypothetical protein
MDLVPGKLIVKTKPVAVVADLIDAGVNVRTGSSSDRILGVPESGRYGSRF